MYLTKITCYMKIFSYEEPILIFIVVCCNIQLCLGEAKSNYWDKTFFRILARHFSDWHDIPCETSALHNRKEWLRKITKLQWTNQTYWGNYFHPQLKRYVGIHGWRWGSMVMRSSNWRPEKLSPWVSGPVLVEHIIMNPSTELKQERHPISANWQLCCWKKIWKLCRCHRRGAVWHEFPGQYATMIPKD